MTTTIFQTTTRIVVPLIVVLSLALFVQGHNQPGGGFIGGVLTATAFALVYIAYGVEFLESEVFARATNGGMVGDFRGLFALGLALALVSGLVPLAWDLAFLAQDHWYVHGVPIYEEVHLASAVAFDLGVYFVVVGGLLAILSVVGSE